MLRLSEAGQLEADLTIMYPPRFLVRRARHERKFNTPKTGTEKGEVIEVCPQLLANGWEDSVYPLKEWDVHFDIQTEDVPECDDYDFWYFALHDRNCYELHREDIRNKGGMVLKESVKTYTKKVFLREKPEKYIIWPHSVSKGWIKRLVYDIPANGVTLTSA